MVCLTKNAVKLPKFDPTHNKIIQLKIDHLFPQNNHIRKNALSFHRLGFMWFDFKNIVQMKI